VRALTFYIVLAILTIGLHAIWHPRTVCACVGTADPALFMWALTWWPHAIAHGLNPFVTHYQWAPTGVNLAQATMVPTAALAMTPFTALFGPIFSYNVMSIASPALSAFTAYLLCRRLVKRELPAVAGGLLFGFSAYEFTQLMDHLNLVTIFLIPVMVHITLRRADREISRRVYIAAMALLLALQLGLSTELLFDCVLLGAIMLVAARFLAAQPQRGRINGLIVETGIAGLLAIAVCSPFLYYALISGPLIPGNPSLSDFYGLDLANLVFPAQVTWLGHTEFQALWTTFEHGNSSESDGYLSIAIMIAFAAWFFTEGYRRVLGRLLAVAIVVSIIMALGSHLHVAGVETVALPFDWLNNVTIFDNLLPSRIVMFTGLAISIGVAAWLAKPGGHAYRRWLLVLVGMAMLLPRVGSSLYGESPHNPSFFSTDIYRHYLTRNETVLVLPYSHNDISTLWQAETGFYFYMPEGYVVGGPPPTFEAQPGVVEMVQNVAPTPSILASFIRAHFVSHALAQLGLHGKSVGGVLLYAVPGAPA
jgi:hypothetical protein